MALSTSSKQVNLNDLMELVIFIAKNEGLVIITGCTVPAVIGGILGFMLVGVKGIKYGALLGAAVGGAMLFCDYFYNLSKEKQNELLLEIREKIKRNAPHIAVFAFSAVAAKNPTNKIYQLILSQLRQYISAHNAAY